MRERSEFAGEEPGAARTAGLRRLSRLTWRATQLSAVTTVGFATFFARTAPAQTAAGDGTAAAAVKTSPPVAAAVKTSPPATSSSGRAYPRRARASASARARALAQPTPQAAARPTAQATIMSSKTA